LQAGPRKELGPRNVVLGVAVGASGASGAIPESSGGGFDRGTGVGWSRGCPRPVWEVGPCGDAAGDGRRRRSRAAAVVAFRPARGGAR
jgi:hypothetical protein